MENEKMMTAIATLEAEKNNFVHQVESIPDVHIVTGCVDVTYVCEGVDIRVELERHGHRLTVGVSYREDGSSNQTYWLSHNGTTTNDLDGTLVEHSTVYTPNDTVEELKQLVLNNS